MGLRYRDTKTFGENTVITLDKDFEHFCEWSKRIRGGTTRYTGTPRQFLESQYGKDFPDTNVFFQSPVVTKMFGVITVDDNLSQLGFQRLVDPYTAFQEIAMFIGGVLGENRDPPAPMTDREKVVAHGFDPRYGFRKLPGKKRG